MSGERRSDAQAPILIVGAGIAGLSAGVALALEGFSVRIFERHEGPRETGAGIQIGPSASRLLARWGVAPAGSVEPAALELRLARTGGLLNAIPLNPQMHERYGAPYLSLERSALYLGLLDRAEELGIEVRWNAPVNDAHDTKSGVEIFTTSGAEKGAALIVADGVYSALRHSVTPNSPPQFSHITAWRAVLPASAIPAPSRTNVSLWMGPDAHLVCYPVAGGASINAVFAVEESWRMTFTSVNGTSWEDVKAGVRTDQWAEVPRAILDHEGANWQAWPLNTIPIADGGAGRIQLIGDAWHAMLPFLASGAAMGIEDSALLARTLKEHSDDVTAGLSRFREERLPRIVRVARNSARMGRIYHFPEPFDRVRNLVIRATPPQTLMQQNDWLYSKRI